MGRVVEGTPATANGTRRAPFDEGAERALLGAAMLAADAAKITADLGPEAFSPGEHRRIADAVTKIVRQGGAVDPVTVGSEIGAGAAVADLMSIQIATPSTQNAPTYAARIALCRNRRQLITLGGELADAGYTGVDPSGVLTELRSITSGALGSELVAPADQLRRHLVFGDAIKDLPKPVPLIDGLLDRDTLAVLYGRSGHGKTFTAVDWSLCVSTGSWWQRHAVTAGKVLYVVAEGASGYGGRVSAWQTHNRVHTVGEITWLTYAPNLFDAGWQAALADYATELQPALIVIDTLARSMAGGDENSGKDIGVVIAGCDRIRRACGACVLLVHHTGKNEAAGMRGHSALEAAVDASLECKLTDEGAVEIVAEKQKDRPSGEKIKLKMVAVGDSVALSAWTGMTDEDELPDQANDLLATLRDIDLGDGVSASVWMESAKASKTTFYRWRKTFVDRGWVVKSGTRFSLGAAGRAVLDGERPVTLVPDEEF